MANAVLVAYRAAIEWLRRRPTASVALAILGVILFLLGPVLWGVGGWTLLTETTHLALVSFNAITEPDKRVEAYGKLVGALGLLVAAPVGLLGVGLAFWRTWNQHRDGVLAGRKLEAESYAKAAEAFAKAVDHLGSEKSSVRMGAALALEALGKSAPRLLSQTIEILCAFVRENRALPDPLLKGEHGTEEKWKLEPCPTDIQVIIETVRRLKQQDVEGLILINLSGTGLDTIILGKAKLSRINLSGASLQWVDLSWADLSNANLIGANLSRAYLIDANLSKANLSRANLNMAIMSSINLSKAQLLMADLRNSDLAWANLSDAELSKTNLSDSVLSWANLSKAIMVRSNLSKADLAAANLSDANLRHANLSGADLSDCNLSRANLIDADLKGANLSRANLSGANLGRANLGGANLEGTDLSKAKLCLTIMSDGKLSNRDCPAPSSC